jgi:hypothetical protein
MQLATATAAPIQATRQPAGPPEGTDVARIVFDGMPGEGVYRITKGARLTETTWTSLDEAKAGVAALTDSDDVGAAGIFRRDGRYEAYDLGLKQSGNDYYGSWNDNVARTVTGRGLVAIIDGTEEPNIMSEVAFRHYERYAGGE